MGPRFKIYGNRTSLAAVESAEFWIRQAHGELRRSPSRVDLAANRAHHAIDMLMYALGRR